MERVRGCEVTHKPTHWICTEHWSVNDRMIHVATSAYGDGEVIYAAWSSWNNNPDKYLEFDFSRDLDVQLPRIMNKFFPVDQKTILQKVKSLQAAVREVEQL